MSSDEDSEDSEQRAVTDAKVDAYFPQPVNFSEFSQLTNKGFKAISKETERDLEKRGIMTYYRGHQNSFCCEACDDALRRSEKYARSKYELKPVKVQAYKYIDKRKIGCEMFSDKVIQLPEIKTGYILGNITIQNEVTSEEKEKKEIMGDINSVNTLMGHVRYINRRTVDNSSMQNLVDFISVIMSLDLPNLFFNSSSEVQESLYRFKKNLSRTIEFVRQSFLDTFDFDEFENQFSFNAAIVLVMLEESMEKRGAFIHFTKFIHSISNDAFSWNKHKMVKELSKLPILKRKKITTPKIHFENIESLESETHDEFTNKRKKSDKCPFSATGRKFEDYKYV